MSTRDFLSRRFGSTSLLDSSRRATRTRGDTASNPRSTTPTRTRGGSPRADNTRTRGSVPRSGPRSDSRSGRSNSPSFVGAHNRLARSGGTAVPGTTGYRQRTVAPGYSDTFRGTDHATKPYYAKSHGAKYHRPYYHRPTNRYCGFYYGGRVAYAYVPYGFYGTSTEIYIDNSEPVEGGYEVDRYEETQPPIEQQDRYDSAAGSAAAEKYMREATGLFSGGEYPEAARRFRLAAIAAPDTSAPLFALGQALIPLENFPYAAKVIRQAIDLQPTLLREGGDLGSVYKSREEFGRVQSLLVQRIKDRPDDLHAPFLLGVMQYYGGDPAARETFAKLQPLDANDRIVNSFLQAANERFEKAADLPPIDLPKTAPKTKK